MPNPQRGPKGKVFEPQLSPEARARIEREHREAVTRTTNEAMANMPLNRACGRALENLNILCQKIGAPAIQTDTLKKDFAKMMIDEALNGKIFNESYQRYYNKMLSDLLAAGVKAQNEKLFQPVPAGGRETVLPRANEITDTFEGFMQAFSENMRANGIRRANYLLEYGGNDAKGLFDIQMATHKTLIRDKVQTAYEKCSNRGRSSVSQTCQAAREAVENAFVYANAFPDPSLQRADMTNPDILSVAVKQAAEVIRGLQEAHSSRSLGWMLRHPIEYLRETATIRSLKGVMRERGGLTRAEVAQKLSTPKKTYDEVSKDYDEICDRYSDRKLAEAERELAEVKRQREVENAKAYSKEKMLEEGLDKERVYARGKAEYEADINALEQLENQPRDRSYDEPDQNSDLNLSENDKVPIEIAEEQAEEKSEPIADNEKISAPQIDIK